MAASTRLAANYPDQRSPRLSQPAGAPSVGGSISTRPAFSTSAYRAASPAGSVRMSALPPGFASSTGRTIPFMSQASVSTGGFNMVASSAPASVKFGSIPSGVFSSTGLVNRFSYVAPPPTVGTRNLQGRTLGRPLAPAARSPVRSSVSGTGYPSTRAITSQDTTSINGSSRYLPKASSLVLRPSTSDSGPPALLQSMPPTLAPKQAVPRLAPKQAVIKAKSHTSRPAVVSSLGSRVVPVRTQQRAQQRVQGATIRPAQANLSQQDQRELNDYMVPKQITGSIPSQSNGASAHQQAKPVNADDNTHKLKLGYDGKLNLAYKEADPDLPVNKPGKLCLSYGNGKLNLAYKEACPESGKLCLSYNGKLNLGYKQGPQEEEKPPRTGKLSLGYNGKLKLAYEEAEPITGKLDLAYNGKLNFSYRQATPGSSSPDASQQSEAQAQPSEEVPSTMMSRMSQRLMGAGFFTSK